MSNLSPELVNKGSDLIIWGNIIFINEKGETGKHISGKFPRSRLKRYMCMPHQAAFHNRHLFEKYGLFDTNVKICMDYDLLLRFFPEFNHKGYLNHDVAYMLVGGNSQKNKSDVISEMRELQIKNNVCSNFTAAIWYYWAHFKNIIKHIVQYDPQKF